jgi:predicted RNase H-like nuclease
MSGGPPLASKKSAAGVGQRLAALRPWLPSVEAALGGCPSDVPIDDALDALACLWTAERWAAGTAMTIPEGASRPPFIAV